jgi:hypothetical protein
LSGVAVRASPRAIALVLGAAAVGRVIVHGALDRRPVYGGAEPSDLVRIVRHHWSVRGIDAGVGTVGLFEDPYKPPLYYAGLPKFFEPAATLDYPMLAWVGAAFLALALLAAWKLGGLLGGPRLGAWSVAITAALPAVAGRATIVGVEPLHLALVGWSLVALLQVHRDPGWRPVLQLGVIVAVGLLTKWTFAIPLAAAVAVQAVRGVRRADGRGRRLGLLTVGLLLGAAPFLAWLLLVGDPAAILGASGGEATTAEMLGMPPLLYLGGWMVTDGLGLAALPVVVVAALAWRSSPLQGGDLALLVAPGVALLIAHTLIPHKEVRYLLPAFAPLAVVLASGLDGAVARGRPFRGAALAAAGWLVAATFVAPSFRSSRPLESQLRLAPDGDDRGLDRFVRHSSLTRTSESRVAAVLSGERWQELRDMLLWELYARNDTPVVLLHPRHSLSGADQLAHATHFLSDRPLRPDELTRLTEAGFRHVLDTVIEVPEGETMQLWERSR